VTTTGADLASIMSYPVKGFSGQSLPCAELRPGGGVPYDRVLAVAQGHHGVPRDGRWAPSETFTRLTTDTRLLGFDVAVDPATETVTLAHPEHGRLVVALDDPTSLERASVTLRDWLDDGTGKTPTLVRADNGYWDVAEGAISIINLDSVDALSRAMGKWVDPLRFRGNLYLSGLGAWEEHELVGERIAIGEAELEVLHPMSRCRATSVDPASSAENMNVPAELTRRFGHIFCGVRARVVAAGALYAGDTLTRTGHHSGPVHAGAGPAPSHWPRRAQIVRRQPENDEVTSIWLRDPPHRLRSAPLPGQHLRIHAADKVGPMWRCYTISGLDHGDLRISVQREPGGRMSRYLHEQGHQNGRLLISGPHGPIGLEPDSRRPLLLASAGIGITQTLAMATACADRSPERVVVLCHTARNGNRLALWPEAVVTLNRLPHARSLLFLTHPEPHDLTRWGARKGRPNLAGISERLLPTPEFEAYLCGPPEFMRAARDDLVRHGLPDTAIQQEVFTSPRAGTERTTPPPEPGPFQVTFTASEVITQWRPESGTLLDLAERVGVQVPAGCRSGACQLCGQPVSTGSVAYTTPPVLAPPARSALLCCAVPSSDVSIPL